MAVCIVQMQRGQGSSSFSKKKSHKYCIKSEGKDLSRARSNIHQNCSVIKTAAPKTKATRKTRQAHKASDPDRSSDTGVVEVECSSIFGVGDAGSVTAAARAYTAV